MFRLAALVFSAWVLLAGCTGPTYTTASRMEVRWTSSDAGRMAQLNE